MQRKPLIVLVLLLALGAAAGIALLVGLGAERSESPTASPVASAGEVAPDRGPAAPQSATPAGPALFADESAERSAAAEKKDEPAPRIWDPAATVWVNGSVALPRATPGDENLEILAFESDGDPTRRFLTSSRELELGRDGLLARVEVGPSAEFEIGLPPDLDRAYLVLHGRYLYCRAATAVALGKAEPREPPQVEITPELGAWVTGRLVLPRDASEEERDLHELETELDPDPIQFISGGGYDEENAPPGREVRPDAELAFEFGGVVPGLRYVLRAAPERLAAAKSAKFEPHPGEHVVLDLALARGGSIAGRVVDAEGRGIAEADIEVLHDPVIFGQGGFEVRDGESGADGAFELRAVAAGKGKLRVEHEGFLDEAQDIELAQGQRVEGLEIRLDRGHRIAGSVLWPDRTPVADIEVDVMFDLSQMSGMGAFNAFQGARGEDETDGEGRFEVSGLGKGPFTVRAAARPAGVEAPEDKDEDEDPTLWRARADGVKPGTEGLELVLEPPLALAGRAVDDRGEPVTVRFEVHARTKVGGMIPGMGSDTRTESFEDPEGSFALGGLRRGAWELGASAAGFGQGKLESVDLPRADGGEPLVLVLERAASVSGVVLAPDGTPAAGAKVAPERTMQNLTRGMGGDLDLRASAGDDGSFTLTGLPSGSCSIVASAPDWADSEPFALDVAPAQPIEGVVLKLRQGGRLLGEIFDAQGKPAPGKTILAQIPARVGLQRFANSDPEGHFEMNHMPPGNWQVMTLPFDQAATDSDGAAEGGGGGDDFARFFSEMKIAMAEIKDGEDTHVLLGAPPKDPVRVHGRVLLDERPVPEVLVSFIADGFKGMEAMRFTNTGAEGTYEVKLNEPGSYLITVQKLDGAPGQQQSVEFHELVPESDDHEHELDLDLPVGGISGSVRGPDGRAAANVRVSLSTEGAIQNGALLGGNYAEVTADAEGRYELVWLRPGTYTVAAGGSTLGGLFGTNEAGHGRQIKGGLKLEAGEWMRGIDFRLQAPGELAGVVRDSAGEPVKDAAIFIRDEAGRPLERLSMTVTDASGRFTYGNLQPGSFTITARSLAQASAQPVQVRVREGETSKVELALAPATLLIVSLSDEEGRPIDCSVSVLDESGLQVNGLMSLSQVMEAFSGGTFSTTEQRIGPLPPGKYRVVATAKDGASSTKPVVLTGQPERKLNLRLKE